MAARKSGLRAAAACAALLLAGGCGGESGSGSAKTSIPECGFVMALPAGWTTEDHAETEFFRSGDRENCWGMAKFCPLSTVGKKFERVADFARFLIKEDRFDGTLAELISERPLKVGQVQADAHEVIYKNTEGSHVYTLFIQMDSKRLLQQALQVVFLVSPGQRGPFEQQYAGMVQSIQLTTTEPKF